MRFSDDEMCIKG